MTLLAFLTSLGSGAGGIAAADPTDTALGLAETTVGQGEFTVNTGTQTEYTQYTDRAVVQWRDDIQQGPDHTLGFRQQAGFVVLNQSPGVRASNFFGTVTCDATCIFANEAGITFHDGSQIDVGQLIVAGGRLTSDDFLAGQYVFRDLLGDVVNHGHMRGSDITLLGRHVANFGHVETPDGSFAMVAGTTIQLRDHDSPIVIESVVAPGQAGVTADSPFGDTPAVENAGRIDAGDGEVRLAAGDMLSFAIRQSGEIRARTIEIEGGDGGLVEVGGLLDASDATAGATGGTIDVLGDYVAVVDDAVLDASGSAGGGRIRVGGDRLGQGPVRTARGTYLHPDATLRADALDAGDGGEVIVYAEDMAEVYGHISAQGGVDGGDGGFVETSGKRALDVRRAPEVGARSGDPADRGGEWLIDPNNVEIVAPTTCGSAPQCLDDGLSDESLQNPQFASTGPVLFPTVDDSKITSTLIASVLEGGSNVTIFTQTIEEVQGTQVGNITVNAPILLDEANAPGPGTDVTLSLFAAQNLVINDDIAVVRRVPAGQPRGESDLQLELVLFGGDNAQFQAPAPADQVPNNFLGQVDVRADLDTAGGNVTIQGLGVKTAAGTTISTNGGAIDMNSAAEDVVLRGAIDTSTDVLNELTGELLTGGRIEIDNLAARVPESGAVNAPTNTTGGSIEIFGDVTTGGGDFDVTALGGESLSSGVRVAATVDTGGGALIVKALEQTLAGVSPGDVSQTGGGRITIEETGTLRSDGGDIDVGVADLSTLLPGAREIVMNGTIDSRVYDAGTGLPDPAARGGFVFLNTVGSGAKFVMGEGTTTGPTIVTNGGRIDGFGDGSFTMVDGTIDASTNGTLAESEAVDSNVFLQHQGGITIRSTQPMAASSLVAADDSVTILAGADGVGDLVFQEDASAPGAAAEIRANRITLGAGDGATSSGATGAQVLLGNTAFVFPDLATPDVVTSFTLLQDADLATGRIVPNLAPHLGNGLTTVALAATDGTIDLSEATLFQADGLGLELAAGKGITVSGPDPNPPATPPLESLDITVDEAFTVDATLADFISGTAKNLSIAGGTPADTADPSLSIVGSDDGGAPMDLVASESLTLQGGRLGSGDLAFSGHTRLVAKDITLQAGNGDSTGTSAIRPDGLADLAFDFGIVTAGETRAFTLRQDAALDDAVIPDPSQFTTSLCTGTPCSGGNLTTVVGVAGVDYTLRTDASGSAITLDSPGAARLRDTDLSLFANGAIDLTPLADQELVIRSLQIGGLGSFAYTADHNDKFRFSDTGASRELVIRAALNGSGLLSFAGGLTITADRIRLVAGDGVGGGGASAGTGGSIALTPLDGGAAPVFRKDAANGPDEFVFRQDLAIVETALPSLDVHFGGNAPDKLAIRSDDGEIAIDDFTGEPLFSAGSEVVLSAPVIDLDRMDGSDLVIDDLFGDGAGGTPASIQMRADVVRWSTTNPTIDLNTMAPPEIDPGAIVRLAAFDVPDPDAPIESPPAAFDFGAVIDEAPELFTVVQDGDVDAANLIDLARVGTGASPVPLQLYEITSNLGSITIRPDDVTLQNPPVGAAQADVILNLAGLETGLGGRTVRFDDPTDQGYRLESLQVVNPFDWTVENATGTRLDLTTEDFIELLAGLSNTGNLSFGQNVTLDSRAILLQAGDDPQFRFREAAPDPPEDMLPVVDATSNTPTFRLEDRTVDQTGTILRIFQHGQFSDTVNDPANGIGRIVDASQIQIVGAPLLDQMQLSSFSSDIEILDWSAGNDIFPTRDLILAAGTGGISGGTLTIEQQTADADLDLSVDGSDNRVFEQFGIFADDVRLKTYGTGVIRARGANLLILGSFATADAAGNPIFTSPQSIVFSQDAAPFIETALDAVDHCLNGCLPEAFQLGPSLAAGIDYTIESRNGGILVNDPLTTKVWGSNLTLLANDASANHDVVFDIPTRRELDFFLSSLTVGDAATPDTRILMRADAADAFDDLTIVTSGAQTYYGDVTLDSPVDGQIELVGDVVEFAGTVDKDAAAALAELVVGVVTEARFDGDVGMLSALDRLRLNFDPAATASSTVRFGTEAGGSNTTVNATTVEFVAVSDAAADTLAPRAPVTSTIYKRNGDLTFHTDTFTMGIGEKLTVQGNLVIDVDDTATLGDLSALTIRVGASGGGTPTIAIQRRAPGNYLARDGTLQPDGGIDFVANTIDFDGTIVLTGDGKNPIFGLADPKTAPAFMNGFAVLAAQDSTLPLTTADFDWAFSVLPDLHPEGASRDDPSNMYWANDLVPRPPAWEGDAWLPWQRSQLTDLFVFARPLDGREYARWLDGAAIIDDVGRDLQAWDGRPLPVAAQRLDGAGAKRAVDLFEQIFGADGGNVPHLRRVLQRAVDEYVRNTGARRVVGFELRRYVKNRPSSLYQAHKLLDDLDALFADHRGLGLTPGEYRPIQARWLDAIRPEGITTRELAEAVQPSRYVRGSDVLDIFGD